MLLSIWSWRDEPTSQEVQPLKNVTDKRCTRSIGVFLWLKRNSIVLLRQPPLEHSYVRGDLRDAPYLNVHGESERDVR